MVSCASVNSMPISFSALCIISLVILRDGVGEGDGVGICARAFNGDFETAKPAAPAAGSSLTKLRRLIDVRFVFIEVLVMSLDLAPQKQASLVRAECLSLRQS